MCLGTNSTGSRVSLPRVVGTLCGRFSALGGVIEAGRLRTSKPSVSRTPMSRSCCRPFVVRSHERAVFGRCRVHERGPLVSPRTARPSVSLARPRPRCECVGNPVQGVCSGEGEGEGEAGAVPRALGQALGQALGRAEEGLPVQRSPPWLRWPSSPRQPERSRSQQRRGSAGTVGCVSRCISRFICTDECKTVDGSG